MAQGRGKLEERIRELESRLPVVFDWFTGTSQPPVGTEGITFWEDRKNDVAKILMRRKNKVYIFTAYPFDPGDSDVTIVPDAHAHRHATGNSTEPDVGLDPITPYSFTWTYSHLFQPTSNVVAVTIDPSSSGATPDCLHVLDRNQQEMFVMTSAGIAAFSGATETARVNIKSAGGPQALAPDELASVSPVLWMDADDITGLNDGHPAYTVPEKITTNDPTQWEDSGVSGTNPVTYRTTGVSGSNPCIEQPATATDLVLDQEEADVTYIDGAFSILIVYRPNGASDANANWVVGKGRADGGDPVGISAPVDSAANGRVFFYTETNQTESIPKQGQPGMDTSGDTTKIVIVRRDGSNNITAFGTAGGVGTTFTQPPDAADTAGRMQFKGLFAAKNGTTCPPSHRVAEFVVFDGKMTDADMQSLYQWAAVKYSLTLLTSGGDDILYCYDTSDDVQVAVTAAGSIGVGTNLTSPAARVHIIDTSEQLRLGYDASNYVKFTTESDHDLLIENATGNYMILKSTGRLGLGVTTPGAIFELRDDSGGAHVRISYDGSNHSTFTVDSNGNLDINNTGSYTRFLEQVRARYTVGPQLRAEYGTNDYMEITQANAGTCTFDITSDGTPMFYFADPVRSRPRRDVIGNQGAAASYPGEFFLEDRSGSGKGDILWLSVYTGAAYEWKSLFRWGGV